MVGIRAAHRVSAQENMDGRDDKPCWRKIVQRESKLLAAVDAYQNNPTSEHRSQMLELLTPEQRQEFVLCERDAEIMKNLAAKREADIETFKNGAPAPRYGETL